MKHDATRFSRIVSFLMALCLLIGLIPTIMVQNAEAYNANNAEVATDEQLKTFANSFTLTDQGGGMRIINGELWVWGSNSSYELGMYTINPETGVKTPVSASTVYPSPVRHPLNDELESGDKFVKVQGSSSAGFALTDNGHLFYWGGATHYFGVHTNIPKELEIDLVTANSEKIVDFHGGNVGMLAVSNKGTLYYAGSYMGYTDFDKYPSDKQVQYRLFPMSQKTEDSLQKHYNRDTMDSMNDAERSAALRSYGEDVNGGDRRKVYKGYICGSNYGSLIITQTNGVPDAIYSSGDVHTLGNSTEMQQTKPLRNIEDINYGTGGKWAKRGEVDTLFFSNLLNGDKLNYGTAVACTYASAVIDSAGNVWASGNCFTPSVGYANERREPPRKIFDAAEKTVRAKSVYVSNSIILVLAQDNSVWAFGRNAFQFIDANEPDGATVLDVTTPIFQEISATQTITGCHVGAKGVMVITKAGDIYWNGDNSTGTAGNGSTENPEGGGTVSANPTNIDPLEPVTKNEISLELEMEEDGTRYRLNGEGELQKSSKLNGVYQSYTTTAEKIKIKAGTQFLLNVYFEDFAKLTGFTVPIRFDPKYLEVVNDNGVAYAQNMESTPGAINGTTGIHETFGNSWNGGYLVGEAGEQGTYPKICNSGGWLSVSGHTLNQKASIEGKVKMFTVRFNVKERTDTDAFTYFALADNTPVNTSMFGAPDSTDNKYKLYDDSATGANNSACFSVPSSKDDGVPGVFSIHQPEDGLYLCPKFVTELILAQDMTLKLQKSDSAPVSEGTAVIGSGPYTHPVLPNANSSETYSVISNLYRTDGEIPSFQNVTWSFNVVAYNEPTIGEEEEAMPVDDFEDYRSYLTIVDEGAKTLKFRVKGDLPKYQAAVIEITATSVSQQENNKYPSAKITVLLKDMDAPESIQIVEKTDYASYTVIYTSTEEDKDGVRRTFTATFPDSPVYTDSNVNTAVTWRLLDKEGNEISSTDDGAAAYLSNPTQATNVGTASFKGPGITVNPNHTTQGDEYLILRAESAYNSSKYDEMYIKVHLNATELKFKQDLLRLPVDSSRDLNSLLLIGPVNDYYDVDLTWEWLGVEQRSTNVGTGEETVTYLTDKAYTRVSTGGVLTSLSQPSVSATGTFTEAYRVKDNLSGLTAILRVQTLQLTSPITANNVTVKNVVGDLADEIVVTGLEAGDIITFYQDYSREYNISYMNETGTAVSEAFTAAKEQGRIQQFTVTANQAKQPSVTFSVQNFLDGKGGEIGVTVYGEKTIGEVKFPKQEFDKIPVSYDAEPSKVYGYISLAGKAAGERLSGISIQLTGMSNPDVVYTDSNGYFEFKTYIQPGNYTMNIYQNNYLRRVIKPDTTTGYAGISIPSAAEFAISTKSDPIILYPGDLNGDGAINATDINQYLRSWFGKSVTDVSSENFAHYDFYDGAYEVIDLIDLDYVARHNGWTRESYPNWHIPTVK